MGSVTDEIPVGAELARDGGGSGDIDVGCQSVIASKLCSHRGWRGYMESVTDEIPVGAKLARESGGSGDIDVGCQTVIASRLTPTGEGGCTWDL